MRAYPPLRNLHLYVGLFLSPFIVVFSVSVFFLVHSWLPGAKRALVTRTATEVVFPKNVETAKGREQIAALRTVLDGLNVRGEIGFVRYIPRDRRFVLPVSQPGRRLTSSLTSLCARLRSPRARPASRTPWSTCTRCQGRIT